MRWDAGMQSHAGPFHAVCCIIAIALATIAAARAGWAQRGEFHPDLPRYAGVWDGAGGGWEVTVEITRTTITPSRSLLRIALACRDGAGTLLREQRSFGHIVDGRQIDLLIRFGGAGGPLVRLYGTVPDLALSTIAGRPACARRATLPMARAP